MTQDKADYNYKRLTGRDLDTFRALMGVFAEAFEDRPAYLGAPASDEYVTNLLDSPHFIMLAASCDGEVVGGLAAYEMVKFEQQRKEMYIYDLAVAAPHRRRGVAANLIATLQAIASQRGAYVIFVQADPPDAPAVALYDKIGTREEVFHFDLPVPQAGGKVS